MVRTMTTMSRGFPCAARVGSDSVYPAVAVWGGVQWWGELSAYVPSVP